VFSPVTMAGCRGPNPEILVFYMAHLPGPHWLLSSLVSLAGHVDVQTLKKAHDLGFDLLSLALLDPVGLSTKWGQLPEMDLWLCWCWLECCPR
jgi:hypothetical protein